MPDPAPNQVQLFYSYAHEDEDLRNQLALHLKILERRGVINGWHDGQIEPGQAWDRAIIEHLEAADLVLLLVSQHFMGSDYIFDVELKRAMQRQQARQCEVVPIIVRALDLDPADSEDLPFLKLQGLPPGLRPVTSWPNQDEAWTQVAKGLRAVVNTIRARKAAAAVAPPAPGLGFSPGRTSGPAPAAAVPGTGASARMAPSGPIAWPGDGLLDQVVQGYVAEVDRAQRQRGGPPLFDHHRYEVQQGAQALIDRAAPARVLWADDLPDNNLHERAMLARLQIEVVTVLNTDDALAQMQAARRAGEPFDLVLSDWSRPPEGAQAALQLLAGLRAAGFDTPVVVYHGEFDAAPRQRRAALAVAAGALGEAVLPAELMALVQRVLLH